jgi:ParB family transcriptional regulator, chromosome partitioning protein
MPNTQNAVNNHEYRSVPVAALIESASNPRKRFHDKSLEELASSFKTQGVLAPLLVRELEPSKYEVVATKTTRLSKPCLHCLVDC